ncbi:MULTISPECIES: DUF1028 domain-containing protein [Actinoalloteichus]|uniref:DUF1028 domain-containing protein n=1 Tax=Actinoalloteichus TaxID=65496 RepID=UPI0018DC013F|nr:MULTISPECIES: DUF1028 domain-containing protein [Actinoalloteichus]
MTFSIVARDSTTGELGAAVAGCVLAIGARAIVVEPGVAAVAVLAAGGTAEQRLIIDQIAAGVNPEQAVTIVEPGPEVQCGAVGKDGAGSWTGGETPAHATGLAEEHYAVQGNLLALPSVCEAMSETFLDTTGPLARRLLAALRAGQQAGGDVRGQQSAGLVVRSADGAEVLPLDLRVDDHRDPLRELSRLLDVHRAHDLLASNANRLHEDADLARRLVEAAERIPGDALLTGWAAVGAVTHDFAEAPILAAAADLLSPTFPAWCAHQASLGGPLTPAWRSLGAVG